jgi:hypothetical protein
MLEREFGYPITTVTAFGFVILKDDVALVI